MISGGGFRSDRHIVLGACLALMVNLGLFALAPLLLDQDVRNVVPRRETVELRVSLPERPSPASESDTEPDREEPAPSELTSPTPELTIEKPEIPSLTLPKLETRLTALPPKVVEPPPPVIAPSAPVKTTAVPVPTAPRQAPGEASSSPVPVQGSAPSSAAAQVSGGDGKGYTTDQVDAVPSVVGQPRPAYPYRARRRSIEGRVKVRFLVDDAGRVHDLSILEASPKGVFEAAVRDAVPRWRFRPGQKAGRAVNVWVETTIQFELD